MIKHSSLTSEDLRLLSTEHFLVADNGPKLIGSQAALDESDGWLVHIDLDDIVEMGRTEVDFNSGKTFDEMMNMESVVYIKVKNTETIEPDLIYLIDFVIIHKH